MPFVLAVTRTVNGKAWRTSRIQIPDARRDAVEQDIARFESGDFPLEGTITLVAGDPDAPAWVRSTRWADVKDLRIEAMS